MTKAPGSGSGPSPVSGPVQGPVPAPAHGYARPGRALAVASAAYILTAAVVLLWPRLQSPLGMLPPALLALVDVVALTTLLLIGALVAARVGGPRIAAALGIRFAPVDLALGFFVALLARAIAELVTPTAGALAPVFGDDAPGQLVATVVTLVGAVLVVPVIEELFFRGALQRALHAAATSRLGRATSAIIAVAVSTAAFTLLHCLPYGAAVPVAVLVGPILVGVGAGVLVAVTGRLAPAVVTHILFNLSAVLLVVL